MSDAVPAISVSVWLRSQRLAVYGGLDFSPVYVEQAKRKNRDARIDFQVGGACALPFGDASPSWAISRSFAYRPLLFLEPDGRAPINYCVEGGEDFPKAARRGRTILAPVGLIAVVAAIAALMFWAQGSDAPLGPRGSGRPGAVSK
jgi:hypothetical protein